MEIFTLQQIRNEWETMRYIHEYQDCFEHYLKDNFVQSYDKNLNLLGYERNMKFEYSHHAKESL